MGKWTIESAVQALTRNQIPIQGTTIVVSENVGKYKIKRVVGIKLWGAIDFLKRNGYSVQRF